MALINKLTDIADAIRRKNGETAKYTLPQMVTKIDELDGGGGGDMTALIEKTLSGNIELTNVKKVGVCAFSDCKQLLTVSLPKCETVEYYGFSSNNDFDNTYRGCTNLTSVELPICTSIGDGAFQECSSLKSIDLPVCTTIGSYAFTGCFSLESAILPVCQKLNSATFSSCYSLTKVVLEYADGIVPLSNAVVFNNCYHFKGTKNATYNPDGLKDGYVFVPDALVENYKKATNWSTLASQIKPLSDLPA